MSNNLSIKVSNLSKCYYIYNQPVDRLKHTVLRRLQGFFKLSISEYRREFWALKDINLEVKKGETVGVVGVNGSGKSTLLELICGTLTQTMGTVHTNGRIVALLELGSGFNPEFNGIENIYLNATILGLSKKEIDEKFDDIIKFADIGEFIHQPVKTYSSGMGIRLAFAVAINVDADILIVDEALSVGDELFQRKCFARIDALKKRGATILFVSHSASTVVDFCDRAILIDSGQLLATGLPKEIIGQYQKLNSAPPEAREEIRNKIITLKKSASNTQVASQLEIDNEATTELDLDDFFDPHLIAQSSISYESSGARIHEAKIFNLKGDQVNNLISGKNYIYSYMVEFTDDIYQAGFAMLIKTISGFQLGGGRSAKKTPSIAHLKAGEIIKVSFEFTCNLNPDTYFINAGVVGAKENSEEVILHRVIDAVAFRVLPIQDSTSTACVDFKCSFSSKSA